MQQHVSAHTYGGEHHSIGSAGSACYKCPVNVAQHAFKEDTKLTAYNWGKDFGINTQTGVKDTYKKWLQYQDNEAFKKL